MSSASPLIGLIDYGAGNLRSVEFALDRLDVRHVRAGDPGAAARAEALILPGVGAAASAMRELERRGWADALRAETRPLLGVCLGLQLLFESSAEGKTPTPALGLLPGHVRRFGWEERGAPADGDGLPVPHMGWNEVRLAADEPLAAGLGESAWFYFLHSFRAVCAPDLQRGVADYGEPFPAIVRGGAVAGVQFHPEKSGPGGARVLANFCHGVRT